MEKLISINWCGRRADNNWHN